MSDIKIFKHAKPFQLESGRILPGFHLAYTTYGNLNAQRNNVVWVFHALTANSLAAEWWHGLVGDGCIFDLSKYFIVCVNMPGSCYGSISAFDVNEKNGRKSYHDFPWFTTRDMIRSYQFLRSSLGIDKIFIGLGGSMGGQQLLEWAVEEPSAFQHIIPIATNAQHSPWGIAFNASQRMCIENDKTWNDKNENAGMEGMKIARSIALLSYRNYITYDHAQQSVTSETENLPVDRQVYKSESYQRYQGQKLASRFNAFSYYFLSKGMDSHNLSRNRGSMKEVLNRITAKTLVIGIETDILFPVKEQQFLADYIIDAKLAVIDSQFGHDGFLLEFEKISSHIRSFLDHN